MLGKMVIVINEKMYRVSDYSEPLRKAQAYVTNVFGTSIILPYLGNFEKYDMREVDMEPGIYSVKKSKIPHLILPTRKVLAQYLPSNVKDLSNTSVLDTTTMIATDIDLTLMSGEIFKPPLHIDDDHMNRVAKIAIAAKGINFDAYGNRLSSMEVGTDPASRKTNAKKAIMKNNTMTATKLNQYCPVFDMQYAIVITDRPGATHPMRYSPLVIYSDAPFDLSKAVNVTDVLEAIYSGDSDDKRKER